MSFKLGLGLVFFVLAVVDLYLLLTVDSLILAVVLAVVTVVVLFRIMKFGLLLEIALLGAFLTYIAAYHFYFQPVERLALPLLSDSILIFVGTFLLVRATVIIGKATGAPVFRQVAALIDGA